TPLSPPPLHDPLPLSRSSPAGRPRPARSCGFRLPRPVDRDDAAGQVAVLDRVEALIRDEVRQLVLAGPVADRLREVLVRLRDWQIGRAQSELQSRFDL